MPLLRIEADGSLPYGATNRGQFGIRRMGFSFRHTYRSLTVSLLGALALAACETTGPISYPEERTQLPEPEPKVPSVPEDDFVTIPRAANPSGLVRVAVLLPFTNESTNIEAAAASMLKAAQMVAFESDNQRFLLIPKDTEGTPEGASARAQEAVSEGAEIILGPLFSENVTAVADIVRPYEIPIISFSTDSNVAGDGVYLLSFPPEAEIPRLTDYALSQGYARFGVMAPHTEYGDRVARSFANQVYDRGGEVVTTARYRRDIDDMAMLSVDDAKEREMQILGDIQAKVRSMVSSAERTFVPTYVSPRPSTPRVSDDYNSSVMASPAGMSPINSSEYSSGRYQSLFLPEPGRFIRALAPMFQSNGVNLREVKVLGLSTWNNALLAKEPALQGSWFAAPDPVHAEGFRRRYQKAYGEKPARLASQAYDAALLTARLSLLPPDTRFSVETITNPSGYLGADGLFRLRRDGMVERGLAILEINGGIQVIDEAPRSFAPATAGY